MDVEKKTFKSAIKKYYADKSLADNQLAGLQQKLNESESDQGETLKPNSIKWISSIAASILLFLVGFAYMQTPTLISSAYVDSFKDADLNNGLQVSMQQWLDENHILAVPSAFPVTMSKFCHLDGLLTAHLRIAGKEQGEMNVFFHYGSAPLFWSKRSGMVDNMNWKFIKVRDNLSLIVLYTEDMREQSVQKILNGLLPELSV